MASPNTPASFGVFSTLLVVAMIIIELLILRYLVHLEQIGCRCAMDWRREYIIFFIALTVVYALVSLFMGPQQIPVIQFTLFILGILNVIFVIQYVNRLKKEKCECSESVYREIMYVIAIIRAALYGLMLLLLILLLFSMMSYQRSADFSTRSKDMNVRPIKQMKPVKK